MKKVRMERCARTLEKKITFGMEKKQAVQIAKDLCYKACIIEQIRMATTSIQIEKALRKGRAMM